ncbi:acyl-CoA synthetase [Niveispirillum sp. BGYR6]|uniref:acyl-CoA synthetase n=1 Tax=Niveispirillum sp. BGYR6 TaxID=2971249 RepID=UPI0022B9C8CF|nr:acyl-CoA synthetase [Niveispirillum sp. BGYR6]MDG5498021.1 acyl-CoA synthetase [Niveispirillum sp. BGYR6]
MHPSIHSQTKPNHPAMILLPERRIVTYAELDQRSNQGAQLFRALGLVAGDTVALCLENCPEFFEVCYAAQRAGLYFVAVSTKLNGDEIRYILSDSRARLLIASASLTNLVPTATLEALGIIGYVVGGSVPGWRDFVAEREAQPAFRIADEEAGYEMLYSSGTTGRPKGIKPRAARGQPIDAPTSITMVSTKLYGVTGDSVFLNPAPLYHAAPLRFCMAMLQLGATVIILGKFDPEATLAAIQRYRVTIAQFVPTHFIRMLKLPDDVRASYDVSSLACVFHAAAPCPIPVKQAMMDWFGPIIHEYYSGSENNGGTFIGPQEWLTHKGSVGRPIMHQVHICDPEGNLLPPRREGLVYFSGGETFEYHNDPAKTAEAGHPQGKPWTTLGDIGWVDEEGYLYLTDRKSFMIISGGVNIYPQEIENILVTHPKVADVAVIGAPDEEMGEKVVAVIQPTDWNEADEALAAELIAFVRSQLSHVKAPRQIDFMQQLPRMDTGKLYKRLIRDQYWAKASG